MTLTVSRLRKRHEHIASFMCSVSKSDILVDWYKDEHELYPSDKYEFVEAECVHGLIIHDLCMADYGSYCVVIGRKRNMHGDHLTMGEAPVQFIIPLEEATVLEGESVTFTCETTDEMAPAKWYKDGKEIVPSDHMQTESKGKVHKLIIPKADIDDRAEYTVQVRDKTSKAPLFVEEKPLKITKPLSERYNSVEGDTLTLVCEVNKPGVVAMWLKDGEQITITDGYEITVDGCRHILTIPDVTLDDEAEYTIMIGSEESTGLVLIEETAAGFTHRLSDTDVNEGEMIQLECTLSRPDVKVRWLKNRKPLTPSDRIKILCDRYRHVLQIMEAIPEDEGEYTIEITENIESSAAIRIRELTPSFIKKLMNKISKEKDSVILECELNKPNIPVRWLKDGVELVPSDRIRLVSDGNIHRLIIDDATLEDSGTYTCVCGSVTTEATLGIDELPAEFKRPLKDITAKEEDQVILECELSKPNKPVKWTKDGKDIVPDDHIHFSADLSTHQMSIDNVSLDDKGDYTCVCGDVATEAKLIIQELPTGVKKPLKDVTVKEKEQVILECELTRPNKPVKWFKDNKEIQPDEHIHFNVDMFTHQLVLTDVNLHDTGVYKLVCGDVSTEAKIVVEELPTEFTKPLADVTVTEKETVCLECEVSKANKPGKWFKNGQEMKQDDNVKFVTYDKTHRLIIKSAVLDDEAEYTVEVDGQTSKSQLYVEEGPVEFLRPLKEVQVMEKEPATLECEVNKPDLVAKWFLDDQEITGSDRVELVVYSTIHQLILHSTSLEDEGKYSVTIEGAKCATTLLVDEPPAELVTRLHDLIVPEKGTAVFECEVSRPWARANWFKDGEPITVSDGYDIRVDGTRHLLYLPKISKEDVGRYTVKIDDKETTARLRVKELPLKIVKPLQKVEVSEKEQVILTCEVNKPNIKAKWFKDKEEVETSENIHITTQETVHTLKITEATLEDAGLYKFQIEDKYSQAKVKVQELPLQFTKPLSDIEVMEGQEATLECVVSRADLPAKWLCKGKPLPKDNRITTTCDKNTHKLVMQSVTMDDQNEYSVKIGDKVSKAKLFVEEEAVEFVRKLTDVEVHEIPSKAIFECELSKPNITAKWFKDNKALPSDKKYKMVVEGPVHRLEISDVDGEDEGDYSIIARGKNSEAELIVEVAPELFLDKNFQESITLKAGQSTAFEIPFKGNPQPKVIWTFNDGELPKDKRLETQTIHNMTTMRLAKAKRPDAGNYKLTLENPRGKTSVDIKMIVLDKPSPPQNLTAPEILADSITLKWEAPEDNGGSDITGYLIEKREFNRRSWQEVEKVKYLEYTVGKLLEGNQYYFRVFAQNEIGMSEPIEFKEPITAKNPFTVPDAPEAPTASDITATSCTVSWKPPANDGGAPITGYQLERQSGFSPRWAPVNKDLIEGITYDLSDLVEDNTYIFRVKAVNKAGPSNPSEPSETYKAKNPWTKPGKPEAPEIMGTDNSSVALKWAPPAEDGGAPITNYVIEYKPVDAFRWLKANETQTVMETTFSVTGLKEGSQLEFRVAAQNKAGVGEASEPTKPVKVEAPLVGEAPKLLEPLQDTTIVSPNDATLECDLLLGEPEAEITWFKGKKEVKKSPKYEMSYEDEVAGLTIHQTKPDDAGVYSCQATNIIGQVQTEGTLSVHTLPQLDYDNKLKSKQSIKAGGSLSLTVNISGIPSPKVTWLLNGETIEKSPRLTMETTEEFSILTIKNATLEDAGNYKITAENVVGKAEADFEVVVKDKPSKPNNLSVPEVQKDSALLSWEQPTDTGGCDITDYIIEKRDAKRNTWTPVDKVDKSTFSYNVMKLLEGNEYYFRVIAKNEIGSSEPAEMDKGTVAKSPFDVPDAPQNLQPSEITKSSMTLTWEQPENNGGSPVIGYMVERKPADSTRWTKVNKKSLSDTMFTAMDLVEGSKYEFRVSAENAAGIGKPSQPTGPILAKNQFEKPDAPRQPEITEVTKNSISLKWVAPEKDGGSPIFNYVIESKPPRSHKWVPVTHNIQVPDCAFTVKDLTEGFEYEFRVLAENKAGLSKPSPSTGPVLAKEPIIGEAPSVLEGIPDVSVLLGEATTLECKINGQPQPSVEWSKDNKTIPSTKKYETSYDNMVASLTLREVTEKDAGTYKCEASNDLGSVSTSGQLEVQAAPKLEYDNKFRDLITLRSGTSLRIPVTVSGIPKPSVTWCKDDQTIKPSSRLNLDTTPTGSTLQVKKATREDDGMYAIMAENEAGDAKATFDVEVTDIPGPPEGPIEVTDLLKDSVTLSWQPPKDDGGSDIKQYNVDMREQNRSQWTKVGSVKAPTTTLTPSRLMDGKQYMFRVTAENDIGVSKPLETSESVIPKSPFGRFGYATRIDKSLMFNINSMMS